MKKTLLLLSSALLFSGMLLFGATDAVYVTADFNDDKTTGFGQAGGADGEYVVSAWAGIMQVSINNPGISTVFQWWIKQSSLNLTDNPYFSIRAKGKAEGDITFVIKDVDGNSIEGTLSLTTEYQDLMLDFTSSVSTLTGLVESVQFKFSPSLTMNGKVFFDRIAIGATASSLGHNAYISSIDLSAGTFDMPFDSTSDTHIITMPAGSVNPTINIHLSDTNASYVIDGPVDVASGGKGDNLAIIDVTAEDGIISMTYVLVFNGAVGLNENEINSINLYPVPASSILNVSNMRNISAVAVSNIIGQSVIKQNVEGESVVLNVSGLTPGAYFLQLYRNNEMVGAEKFIKK